MLGKKIEIRFNIKVGNMHALNILRYPNNHAYLDGYDCKASFYRRFSVLHRLEVIENRGIY